jgi:DNA-binding PucR family transcriptional regulator
MSAVRCGGDGAAQSLRQAQDAGAIARALAPAGGALAYGELGAYRYLVHLALDDAPHDRLCEAVERLLAYDERRETQLVGTLEQYLADRRVGTSTARKLFIHANTLRQRLDRIEKLTELELATEDLLSLELAVKLVRLRRAGVAEPPPRS